jgi:hypothetical protein
MRGQIRNQRLWEKGKKERKSWTSRCRFLAGIPTQLQPQEAHPIHIEHTVEIRPFDAARMMKIPVFGALHTASPPSLGRGGVESGKRRFPPRSVRFMRCQDHRRGEKGSGETERTKKPRQEVCFFLPLPLFSALFSGRRMGTGRGKHTGARLNASFSAVPLPPRARWFIAMRMVHAHAASVSFLTSTLPNRRLLYDK